MQKICPRCNRRLVSINKSYCEVCKSKVENRHKEYKKYRTDNKEQSFYSSKSWKVKKDKIKFRDNYICLICLHQNNTIKESDTVHHIIELKDEWSRRFDENNLISLCESCHQIIHKKYRSDLKDDIQTKLKKIVKE